MAYFLTIREGDAPEDSYPIFATADPEIIRLVARGMARKLDGDSSAVTSIGKKTQPTKKVPGDESVGGPRED